ncbi:hypothetical protein L1987_05255 [Smallanthus sonchifolius]|uniref:Uncharacterized protein n=1 Tax=Smallanthus sonchifolius TaxID=185202 RepID=A0ACB9JUT8_9ASTR|nr:hypothetical protein L1987_05255 [Smallanthus sonchifolius]
MASASPALSNNSGDTTSITGSAVVRTTTSPMVMTNSSIKTSKNLRGLNKPKCIKCGNVARSRCPYQACKSCCAKAQNPCHIHVLKGNSSFPDKTPPTTLAFIDQHSNEISSSGNAHRVTSLRQLSSNFAQFNNLQMPARARKPLTRKEASQINEWRFSKLKEYEDRNIEIENEAFDRYLQNITLLEEVFAKYESTEDKSEEGKSETMISNLKTKLRADPIRSENLREKLRFIVNNGLRNFKTETPTGTEETEHANMPKKARYSSLVELNKKLSSARTHEDLKSCQLLKARLLSQPERSVEEFENIEDGKPEQKSENYQSKWFSPVTVNQEALSHIDAQFSSLDGIEQL